MEVLDGVLRNFKNFITIIVFKCCHKGETLDVYWAYLIFINGSP